MPKPRHSAWCPEDNCHASGSRTPISFTYLNLKGPIACAMWRLMSTQKMCDLSRWYSAKYAVRNTRQRNLRSKIRWFTEFCNSHYVSQFAAFFIDPRAKRSTVKSCPLLVIIKVIPTKFKKWFSCWTQAPECRIHLGAAKKLWSKKAASASLR